MTTSTWTKDLVQQHAQTAVAIELYTIPFYLTAITSIKDKTSFFYQAIFSICIEEMLHLELAANLCTALGVKPDFRAPVYGVAIPFLKPYDPETGHNSFINAKPGAFNETSLQMMLDIETPEEFEGHMNGEKSTPNYPYDSIGEFYDALYSGIVTVGEAQFPWDPEKQQSFWSKENFPQKINSLATTYQAIMTIVEQGEGKVMQPAPIKPFHKDQFIIPAEYRLKNETMDTSEFNQYAHYGRLIWMQNEVNEKGFPPVYSGEHGTGPLQGELQKNFSTLVDNLNIAWDTGTPHIPGMTAVLDSAVKCWQDKLIPQWTRSV